LAHFLNYFIRGINAYLFALNDGIDAVAAVMGTAALGLYPDIKVVFLEIVGKFRPNTAM